jgi:hypothetical protein
VEKKIYREWTEKKNSRWNISDKKT